MTEISKIDGLPEVIEYGGYLVEYVGTRTFTDRSGLWYRHEYAYRDMPPETPRVYFYRAEGSDEPIADVTGFEVIHEVTTRQRRKYKWVNGQHVSTIQTRPMPDAPPDDEAAPQKVRQQLAWVEKRRQQREAKRKAVEDHKTSRELSKRIRASIKPFGGE